MNVMLQRHSAKYIYVIPEGLKELMFDISREVLRTQPQNLYLFIADYLEALLLTRENARVAARLVQSITEIAEATLEFLQNTGMDRPQVDRVVAIVHETFKRRIRDDARAMLYEQQTDDIEEANIITDIIHEAEIGSDLAEEAAKIIQNAYRKFKHRKEAEKQLLAGMIDWRVAARSAIRLYRQTGVTNEEANRAATLIKAAYKGYYTRRVMRKLTDQQKILYPDLGVEEITEGEEEEGDLDFKHITRTDSKNVKIDYDTVKPHVDFGDVTDVESPDAVVGFTLDKLIDNVMRKTGHPEECKYPIKGSKKKPAKGSPRGKAPQPQKKKPVKTPVSPKSKIPAQKKQSVQSAGQVSIGKGSVCSAKRSLQSGHPSIGSAASKKSEEHESEHSKFIHTPGKASGQSVRESDPHAAGKVSKHSVPKKVSIRHVPENEGGDFPGIARASTHSGKGSIRSGPGSISSRGSKVSGSSAKSGGSHISETSSVGSERSGRSASTRGDSITSRTSSQRSSRVSQKSERSDKTAELESDDEIED